MKKVFCHILLFHTSPSIALRCVESVLAQEGIEVLCAVSDNGRTSPEALAACASTAGCVVWENEHNYGFCGGHNIGAIRAQRWGAEYFVVLNPDVVLTPGALSAMVEGFSHDPRIAAVTPKLLQCYEDGLPMIPPCIDAAGMRITAQMRHFDIGSGEVDVGQYDKAGNVFSGTGACLMFSVPLMSQVALLTEGHQEDLYAVYPELRSAPERIHLFDEAFFAYREDAEIGFRIQLLGLNVRYVPAAVALHARTQKGTSRNHASINALSVKNRFLLRALYGGFAPLMVALCSWWRDLVVRLAVATVERSSLSALSLAQKLHARALERRAALVAKCSGTTSRSNRWYGKSYE